MKPKAAFFSLWNKHVPVIKAFADRHPDYLILVPHSGYAGFPMFQSFAGRIIPLDTLLTGEDKDALARSAADKTGFLGRFTSSSEWRDFCADARVPPAAAESALFKNAGPKLLEQMLQIESLERLSAKVELRVVVVNEEYTLLPKSLAVWTKARDIPLLHINHSLGVIGWYTVHDTIRSDALAVYGPIVVDGPMETGLGGERLFITGNPDWLEFPRYVALKPEIRREILARYFHGAEAPLAVFGTTFAAKLTATEDGKHASDSARFFFRAVAALRKTGRALHCVVKFRPGNDDTYERLFAGVAAEEGMLPGEFLCVRQDLEKWLLAADAVVSADSTLSADALMADTLAINIVTEEGWRMGPYYPLYTGIMECRGEDLADCLRGAIEDKALKDKQAEMRRRCRKSFQGKGSGNDPVSSLVGLIETMASRDVPGGTYPGERQVREATPISGPASMTVIIRPASLDRLASMVESVAKASRPDIEIICLVPGTEWDEACARLPGAVTLLRADTRPHSRNVLGALAGFAHGGFAAFLDAHVRLPKGWDERLARHAGDRSAAAPLADGIAGTQSIYHYLPVERINPGDVETVSREVGMRFPGMAMSADWLYDHVLVFPAGLLPALAGLSDEDSGGHFLGLGRKLKLAGAKLRVAKDVFASMEP